MTYGVFAYGTESYAGSPSSTVTTFPFRAVEVEFTAGVWTDVSADVVSISTRRGRNRELGAFDTGACSFTVRNDTRIYDPDHATGPFYGNLRPNRRVRVRATQAGVTYPVWQGYVDRITQVYGGPNDATATFDASDLFKLLNRVELYTSAYATEVRADAPVAWWRLGDPAGSTVALDSAGSMDLAVVGTPTFGSAGQIVRDPTGGMTGTDVSGVRQTGPRLITPPLTLEVWWKHTPAAAGGILIGQTGNTLADGYVFLNTSGADVFFQGQTSSGSFNVSSFGSPINVQDNSTHHLVGVWEADGTVRVYVDGTEYTTPAGAVPPNTFPGATATAFIGGGPVLVGFAGAPGTYQDAAFYNKALSPARVAAHNAAGRTPWNNDLPGTRLGRILDQAAVATTDRNIDAGTTTLQSTSLGGTALAYAQKVEETEIGRLFVAKDGTVRFIGRQAGDTGPYLTSLATLVDDDSGAGLPYLAVSADVDEATVVTRATVSRDGSVAITYTDAAAVAEFKIIDETHDGLLHNSDTYSLYYAQLVVNTHKNPQTRIGGIQLELGKDPTNLYPAILALEIGDRVTYKRKPQNLGSVVTIPMRVEAIAHDTGGKYWRTTLQLSPFNLGQSGYGTGVWDTSLWDQAVWGL